MAVDVAEPETPLLTEDQYASLWQVDAKTVRAWGRRGLVRVLRRRRVTRYLLDVPHSAGAATPPAAAESRMEFQTA